MTVRNKCCVCGVDTENDFCFSIFQLINGKKGKSKERTMIFGLSFVCVRNT